MLSFKEIAYQILKEAEKPLHSKDITRIALKRGWLKTAGKTPEATMNAQLIVDINKNKEESRFIKTGPSTFSINPKKSVTITAKTVKAHIGKASPYQLASKKISTKVKGDIAEARVAELVALYGETLLSCYKPLSDDEGIDLIAKKKGELKPLYIQIKSRFGHNPDEIYTATVKTASVVENYSMAFVFCYFDTEVGDLWDFLWFVPAPDFLKKANRSKDGKALSFVAGRKKKESNK